MFADDSIGRSVLVVDGPEQRGSETVQLRVLFQKCRPDVADGHARAELQFNGIVADDFSGSGKEKEVDDGGGHYGTH